MGDIIYTTIYYANSKPDLTLSWNQLLDDSEKARFPLFLGDVNFDHVLNPPVTWNQMIKTSDDLTKLPVLSPNQTSFKALYCSGEKCRGFTEIFTFVSTEIVTIQFPNNHAKLVTDVPKTVWHFPIKHMLTDTDKTDLKSIKVAEIKSSLHNDCFVRSCSLIDLRHATPDDTLMVSPGVFYRLDLAYEGYSVSKIVGVSFASK